MFNVRAVFGLVSTNYYIILEPVLENKTFWALPAFQNSKLCWSVGWSISINRVKTATFEFGRLVIVHGRYGMGVVGYLGELQSGSR